VGLDEILGAISSPRARFAVGAVLIALVGVEGTLWAHRYLRTPTPMPMPVRADYLAAISPGAVGPARVVSMARSLPGSGSAPALGLQLVTGYDPFNLRHYQRYVDLLQFNEVREPRAAVWTDIDDLRRFDMLAALNVLYIVAPRRIDVPDDYELVGEFSDQPQFRFYEGVRAGPVYVYRNRRFLARAFFASEVVAAATEDQMDRLVANLDLREKAVALPPSAAGMSVAGDGDYVRITASEAGSLRIEAQNARARYLVISEVWHPGWRATVSGRPVALSRTDVALQGLWLEPGRHTIELDYWPPGLTIGLVVSAMSVLLVAGLLVNDRWRGSRLRRGVGVNDGELADDS
jgi:hypothetical protein